LGWRGGPGGPRPGCANAGKHYMRELSSPAGCAGEADVSKFTDQMELSANGGASLAIEYEIIFRAVARNRAAGGRGKMRGEDKPPAVGVPLEELETRASRLIGVHAKARAPCRIAYLQRVMHQVGADDRFPLPAAEPHEREPGRVAGRRFQRDVAREHVLVADQVRLSGLEDG